MKMSTMWMSTVPKHEDFDLEEELAAAVAARKVRYPTQMTNIAWVNPEHLEKERLIQGVLVKPSKSTPVLHIFLGEAE